MEDRGTEETAAFYRAVDSKIVTAQFFSQEEMWSSGHAWVRLTRQAPGATPSDRAGSSLFAWLQNYRGVVVRYERHAENPLGMLHLACCLILRRCL